MIVEHTDVLAEPDGFFGSILAVEGITDACTILNAPTGCKMHIGELSKDQFRREVGQHRHALGRGVLLRSRPAALHLLGRLRLRVRPG